MVTRLLRNEVIRCNRILLRLLRLLQSITGITGLLRDYYAPTTPITLITLLLQAYYVTITGVLRLRRARQTFPRVTANTISIAEKFGGAVSICSCLSLSVTIFETFVHQFYLNLSISDFLFP
ncbi:Threonine--tRNA ligase 2, cytoplasmic [Frankliniella fusca]|uniref:Threonine--tRNA ligase 2, cytoplasmic n=1 Tax=Frankliniella fusca TaxID=407009 RepID=A0AAE1GSR8_9NEOP|nr:Threonine--tRNA ligase 2, cytoplasmic [Frankliniella fusca]